MRLAYVIWSERAWVRIPLSSIILVYHFLVDERRSVLLHAKGLLSHFGILGVRAGTVKIDPGDSLQLCNSVTKHVPSAKG